MKTMQAEYTTALERIAGDQKAVLERTSGNHKTAIEKLSKELAQRDRALLLAILGMIALAVAILKFA